MVLEFLQNLFNNIFTPGITVFKPLVAVPSPVPPPVIVDNRARISFLQGEVTAANQFLRRTFAKPRVIPPGCKTCIDPIALAKGAITAIDPFTGARLIVGFGSRAGNATRALFAQRFTAPPFSLA